MNGLQHVYLNLTDRSPRMSKCSIRHLGVAGGGERDVSRGFFPLLVQRMVMELLVSFFLPNFPFAFVYQSSSDFATERPDIIS